MFMIEDNNISCERHQMVVSITPEMWKYSNFNIYCSFGLYYLITIFFLYVCLYVGYAYKIWK